MKHEVLDCRRVFYSFHYKHDISGRELAKLIKGIGDALTEFNSGKFEVFQNENHDLVVEVGGETLTIPSGRYVVVTYGTVMDIGPLQLEGMLALCGLG